MRRFAAAPALVAALGAGGPVLAGLVLTGLVLAGCGGSAAAPPSQPAAATSPRPAASGGAPLTSGSGTPATTTATVPAAAPSTAGTGGTGSGTGGASVAGPPLCRAGGLALSYLGGQGATGHAELGFALRNTTGRSCSTGGYPGIQFLDAAGAALPTTPAHTTSDFFGHLPLAPLVVAPGQSVSFRLGVSHGDGPSGGCATAAGLQVIPPDDTATLTVPIPTGAAECGATTVSPMQPGGSAYR